MTMEHPYKRCTAIGCKRTIPRALLMCFHHWNLVPPRLQVQVYRTLKAWNNGQSAAPYVDTVKHATLLVAEAESINPDAIQKLRNAVAAAKKAEL